MHYFKRLLPPVVFALVIFGCVDTVPVAQKSTFIVLKTPVLKYADQGFIEKGRHTTKIEIYAGGAVVMKLEIGTAKICNSSGLFSCMSKREFTNRYLSTEYPEEVFEHIFRGEEIFAGKNLVRKEEGFAQRLFSPGHYAIDYSVFNHSIVFRDTLSHILIKVKENR